MTVAAAFCASGVPRGVLEGGVHPPPPKFRRPSKIVPNSTWLWKLLKIAEFRLPTLQYVRKKGSKILKLPSVHNCFTLAMTDKLVVIINSLKVPKIEKILLYDMKFFVPNYSCLQNPMTRGLPPPDPLSLCRLSWTEFVEPPLNKIPGYATVPCHSRNWDIEPDNIPTNSTEQNRSWKAASSSASNKMPYILYNLIVYCCVHRSLPVAPGLTQCSVSRIVSDKIFILSFMVCDGSVICAVSTCNSELQCRKCTTCTVCTTVLFVVLCDKFPAVTIQLWTQYTGEQSHIL